MTTIGRIIKENQWWLQERERERERERDREEDAQTSLPFNCIHWQQFPRSLSLSTFVPFSVFSTTTTVKSAPFGGSLFVCVQITQLEESGVSRERWMCVCRTLPDTNCSITHVFFFIFISHLCVFIGEREKEKAKKVSRFADNVHKVADHSVGTTSSS